MMPYDEGRGLGGMDSDTSATAIQQKCEGTNGCQAVAINYLI